MNAPQPPDKQRQMSEAFSTLAFLTLSGGLQDAYSYCVRGQVFANAQTGNIVLMSQHLFQGNWPQAGRYALPLLAFALGVFAAQRVRTRCQGTLLHWRQLVLAIEVVLLFAVGLLPHSLDALANALVSFTCAMQVQTFRKVEGSPYASTMCIGNLRSGMDCLCAYLDTRQGTALRRAGGYFALILIFGLGAGLGSLLALWAGQRAIWSCCLLLLVSFFLMFQIRRESEP